MPKPKKAKLAEFARVIRLENYGGVISRIDSNVKYLDFSVEVTANHLKISYKNGPATYVPMHNVSCYILQDVESED